MSENTPLQHYANFLVSSDWVVTSMTDQQIVATRKKDMNAFVGLLGFIGLFVYCIPGLLIFIAGYLARGTESRVVTVTEAENWVIQINKNRQVAHEKQEALAQRKQQKLEERQQKLEELTKSGGPLSFWYTMSSTQQTIIVILFVAVILILMFAFAFILDGIM